MVKYDVIILGAGAAGMFCAIEAGRRGRSVLVIDHGDRAGEKIRISGGGRCNFTNRGIQTDRFLSHNPRFALSALKRYTQFDFIDRMATWGIAWHEKTLGQLFCDGSAKDIVAALMQDMQQAGVDLSLETSVNDIRKQDDLFALETSQGPVFCSSLVVATGGKSIPKMGATGIGYQIAEHFGIGVLETRPGLVPLTLSPHDLEGLGPIAGTAVTGAARCGKRQFAEAILFTHRGLSGPAILQISSYWREGDQLRLDLAGGKDVAAHLKEQRSLNGKIAIRTALGKVLTEKLARHIEGISGLQGNLADQGNVALDRIAALVHDYPITPVGSEGYRTAEVTLGGVDTAGLDAKTLQAKSVAGLYFIGEVVDVTGWLGGYNFQWAWSSGWAAGQSV